MFSYIEYFEHLGDVIRTYQEMIEKIEDSPESEDQVLLVFLKGQLEFYKSIRQEIIIKSN